MAQSSVYKNIERVDYLAKMVGSDIAADVVKTIVENSDGDRIDPATEDTLNALAAALDSKGNDSIRVKTAADLETNIDAALKSTGTDSLLVDSNAALDVSSATVPVEQQTPVGVEDSVGTQVDPATEGTLSSLAGTDFATETTLATLADALASNGTDHLHVQEDSALDVSAAEVDVDLNSQTLAELSTDIAAALASNGTDYLHVQEDSALDVSAAEVDVDLNSQTLAELSTDIAAALASNGTDHLHVQEDSALDVSAAEVDVDLNSQTLGSLATDIAAALASNGTDHLHVQEDSALDVSAAEVDVDLNSQTLGSLAVQEATPLDVSATEVDVDLNSQTLGSLATDIAAALASNGTDHLHVQEDSALDVSGATVTVDPSPNAGATAFENGTALGSGGTLSNSLSLMGAGQLSGRVVRASTSYDVHVDWEDSGGNVLFTTDVATGVAAGTETDINISPLESPHCTVRVVDAGAGSGAVTASLYAR